MTIYVSKKIQSDLPMDIISTKTFNCINSAAKDAKTPNMIVAKAGVPVSGQTVERCLKYIIQ